MVHNHSTGTEDGPANFGTALASELEYLTARPARSAGTSTFQMEATLTDWEFTS